MSSSRDEFLITTIVGTCILLIFLFGFAVGRTWGYRSGQIDAISKKNIAYELVVRPDSTRVWEVKK